MVHPVSFPVNVQIRAVDPTEENREAKRPISSTATECCSAHDCGSSSCCASYARPGSPKANDGVTGGNGSGGTNEFGAKVSN